jgi:hypothetical protein
LKKKTGAVIDKLNENRKNCLDLAIAGGHTEVVKVLLNDKNWYKLIRTSNHDDSSCYLDELNELNIVAHSNNEILNSPIAHMRNSDVSNLTKDMTVKLLEKLIENPEMTAMFESKMWDGFKIILDKCVVSDTMFDFTKMDINVFSSSKHPLMYIARSGQESLLKHKTVTMLLNLKWKLLPRFAFYFNILFYLVFLLLLSIYSMELANYGSDLSNNTNVTVIQSGNITIELPEYVDIFDLPYTTDNWLALMFLFIIIVLNITKELFQMIVLEGLAYFVSMQNIMEMLTYVITLLSVLSDDYSYKSSYGSVAVLFAFLVFPLYIQKVKVFGVYVVAFCRTLKNSNHLIKKKFYFTKNSLSYSAANFGCSQNTKFTKFHKIRVYSGTFLKIIVNLTFF